MKIRACGLVPLAATLLMNCLASKAALATNWALLIVTGGSAGADQITVDLSLSGEKISAPTVYAFAVAEPHRRPWVTVAPTGDGQTRLSTSSGLGSMAYEVAPDQSPGGAVGVSFAIAYDKLRAGEKLSVLVIITGSDITKIELTGPTAAQGSASASVVEGSGSRAVTMGQPEDDGMAVALGWGAVGQSISHSNPPEAIVGGFALQQLCTGICLVSATNPTGASDGRVVAAAPSAGTATSDAPFVGPAGRWSWTWIGDTVGDPPFTGPLGIPVFAIYAPIGDIAASLFVEQTS